MDLATVIGLAIGGAFIIGSVAIGSSARQFWDLPSALLVVGGTLSATLINYRLDQVWGTFRLLRVAFTQREADPEGLVRLLVSLAEKARREGLLAMEEEAEQLQDPFLRKGIQLVVDGTDPELVRNVLDIEITFLEERHRIGQGMFDFMATAAPAFGMMGTLIGLVKMLARLDDPSVVGPGLAMALITTLYGAIMGYLIFMPMAGKLKVKSDEEILLKEMVIEGVLSIQAGENPRIVEEKLRSFLPPQRPKQRREEAAPEAEAGGLGGRPGRGAARAVSGGGR